MSEYNIFIAEDGVTVFDWPQAVPTEHENSKELLKRDVENTVGHFQRKYPNIVGEVDIDRVVDEIIDDELSALAHS